MEFLLAIIVFGGMLAVCFIGFGGATRSANAINTTGSFGRRYSEPPPYAPDVSAGHDAHPAPMSETASTEDHPILQATEAKPRAARDKPTKMM